MHEGNHSQHGPDRAGKDAFPEEGDLLDRPIAALAPGLLEELADFLEKDEEAAFAGRIVGAYRLLRLIARGGMGVVYEAERADAQFEKRVAIKFLPRGLETPEMKRRFLLERQVLANLEHPAITRLLDGGVTDEGFPYLVMELVEGREIDHYCREEKLSLKARLRLFLEVCEAVQCAHQKLVVHRDLKPGNILVTDEGRPKLLDFGIAKLLDEENANQTLYQPNTPSYAPPELIMNGQVSAASDVYSLGAILYELLTGSKPHSLSGRTPGEIAEIAMIRETKAPSKALANDAKRGAGVGEGKRLARRLEGDLDNIVLKALRKEPGRRYGSAAALAEDVSRYLDGLPVRARPLTLRYRFGKFVARHRAGVATAGLVVLLLAVGIGGIVHQAGVARQERDHAEQVADFVLDMLRISDPDQGEGTTITARELLDGSRQRAEEELAGQPAIQARVLSVIAEGYQNLGVYDQAASVLQRVIGLLEPALPDTAAELAEQERRLGLALAASGNPDGGIAHLERAIERRRGLARGPDAVVASMLVDLANAMGYNLPTTDPRRARIEPMLREAIAMSRTVTDGDSPELASALNLLGLELNTQSLKGDGIDRAIAAESERSLRQALDMRRRLYGERSVPVAETLNDLSLSLDNLGRKPEAADLMAQALEIHRGVLGPEHPDSLKMASNLGAFRFEQGRYDEAEALFRDCLAQWRKIHPVDDIEMVPAIYWLARTRLALGDLDGAEAQLRRAIQLLERQKSESRINRARSVLGEVYLRRGDYAQAEPLLVESFLALRELLGSAHPLTREARTRVVRLFEKTGRPADADHYRSLGEAGEIDSKLQASATEKQ